MNLTVMPDPAAEVTEKAIARNAFLVVLGETWLTMFGTDPHGGASDHALKRRGVRVTQAGRPAARTCTAITGRGRPRTRSYDATGGHSAMGPRPTAIARIDEMISRSDIVKLSDEDLAWLRPGDRHGDAIRWLMSRGPAILVVTHGHTAATGYTRSGSVHVRGHRVEVADTAEWEDAFESGLLHALTTRDLLTRRTDRSLRTIGLDDLRGILHDANLCAARAVTPTAVWPRRTAALAAAGSLTKIG
jgi:pfkB family carbohydrate kinase